MQELPVNSNDNSLNSSINKGNKMKGLIKKYKKRMEDRKIIVDILAILFGVGSWVGINGSFVQLPLLVKSAPEAWNLPSYMSVAVQLANLGPITYALLRRLFPKRLNDTYCIYFLLFLGVVTAILSAALYNHTTMIDGMPRSTVFLALVFLTAIVGCTSSVLFFPFMRHFKEMYLISYLIGEGLSGFLPSIVALIQGIGGNPECIEYTWPNGSTTTELIYKAPLFSSHYFFGFIAFAILLSFVAFILLNNLSICEYEKVSSPKVIASNHEQIINLSQINSSKQVEDIKKFDSISIESKESIKSDLTVVRATSLLILMSFICAFSNGVFPSIQSYSCLPYGNTAYHLGVTLSSMANPLACFLAVFLPHTSNRSISVLSSICAVFIAYILSTSILSPTPPLYDSVFGIVIVICVWILAVGFVSYIKLCISTIFRSAGGSWMFYCGGASQAGSAVGSLVSFFLINYTNIFVPSNPCQ